MWFQQLQSNEEQRKGLEEQILDLMLQVATSLGGSAQSDIPPKLKADVEKLTGLVFKMYHNCRKASDNDYEEKLQP
jgi:hypothetical protein